MLHCQPCIPSSGHAPIGLGPGDQALLATLPLFEGLEVSEVLHLIEGAQIQRRAAGSVLFLQGDRASHFYVVLEGWVKLYRSAVDGNEGIISIMAKGSSFAEAVIFQDGCYPVSAGVLEESRLLAVPAGPFLDKVVSRRDYVMKILSSMSRHLHRLVDQVEELALKSSVERLAGYLVQLCQSDSGPVTIRLPLEKAIIAQRLGMQPETLSRSLARLRRLGVESNRGTVNIRDVALLRGFGESGNAGNPGVRPV